MAEGQAALAQPSHRRHTIRVRVPCPECRFSGLCAIEQQIEENLVLEIVEIALDVQLSLECSTFERVGERKRPAVKWNPERRARYEATIEAKRAARA